MTKLDNKHEAAQNLVEAGNCWRKAEPKRATECLAEAIEGKLSIVILSELLCSLHRSGSGITSGQTACYNRWNLGSGAGPNWKINWALPQSITSVPRRGATVTGNLYAKSRISKFSFRRINAIWRRRLCSHSINSSIKQSGCLKQLPRMRVNQIYSSTPQRTTFSKPPFATSGKCCKTVFSDYVILWMYRGNNTVYRGIIRKYESYDMNWQFFQH